MAASSLSFDFIERVRELYAMAYQEISINKTKQICPYNGITDYAIPAYILSVAGIESFINEMFFSIGFDFLLETKLGKLPKDEVRKRREGNIIAKLKEVPELAFDVPVFNLNVRPLQDFNYLVEIRNSFVHYKMDIEAEYKGIIDYLLREGIAISIPESPSEFWVSRISTIEGIRWAHNTSVAIILALLNKAISTNRHLLLISIGQHSMDYLQVIPHPKQAESWFTWINTHKKWILRG